jgi:rSAM/selenodomain-associated transferase 1
MTIPLHIFAKAPIAGAVKTRLQPDCTTKQSAQIAELLLDHCLSQAVKYWPDPVVINTAPNKNDPTIVGLGKRYQVEIVEQGKGSLGQRMLACFERYGYPLAIIGSDAPRITEQSFKRTHQALTGFNSVLGPSEDGGYYLIGLSASCPGLFEGVDWGTSTVRATTIAQATQHEISFEMLDPTNDVDIWEDLLEAANQLPTLMTYLQDQGLV